MASSFLLESNLLLQSVNSDHFEKTFPPTSFWCTSLCGELHELQQQKLFCDVFIVGLDCNAVSAHSCVLSAASPYLKGLLSDSSTNPGKIILTLDHTNITSSVIQHAIDFVYTGRVQIINDELQNLLQAANQLQLSELQNICLGLLEKQQVKKGNDAEHILYQSDLQQIDSSNQQPYSQSSDYNFDDIKSVVESSSPSSDVIMLNVTPFQTEGVGSGNSPLSLLVYTNNAATAVDGSLSQCTDIHQCEGNPPNSEVVQLLNIAHLQPRLDLKDANKQAESSTPATQVTPVDLKLNASGSTEEYVPTTANKRRKIHWPGHPYYDEDGAIKFQCHICRKSFNNRKLLGSHLSRTHSDLRRFMCTQCSFKFKTKNALRQHMQRHGERNIRCSQCNMRFYSKGELTVHERIHTKEKPYICTTCGQGFPTGHRRQRHEVLHHGKSTKPRQIFCCDLCPKVFYTVRELKAHSHRTFTCTVCNMVHTKRSELKRHSQELHGLLDVPIAKEDDNLTMFQCLQCVFTAKTEKQLTSHIRHKHTLIKRFKCDYPNCTYTNNYKSLLTRHQLTHQNPRSRCKTFPKPSTTSSVPTDGMFMCRKCGRIFQSKAVMLSHEREQHNIGEALQFVCQYEDCLYQTNLKFNINRHYEAHEKGRVKHKRYSSKYTKPSEVFVCSQCGLMFGNEPQLTRHEKQSHQFLDFADPNLHEPLQDHGQSVSVVVPSDIDDTCCLYCSQRFNTQTELNLHIRHTHKKNERPRFLLCPICQSHFSVPSRLRRHLLTIHMQEKRYRCTKCSRSSYDLQPLKWHFATQHSELPLPSEEEFIIPGAKIRHVGGNEDCHQNI